MNPIHLSTSGVILSGDTVKASIADVTDQQSEYWRWVRQNKLKIKINNKDMLYYITGMCWAPPKDIVLTGDGSYNNPGTTLILLLRNAHNVDMANKLSGV